MKILVTGSCGFTGQNLMALLRTYKEDELFSCDLSGIVSDSHSIVNFNDSHQVQNIVESIKPDLVYHLIGSFSNSYEIDYANNVLSTRNLIEALITSKVKARVFVLGTAAEYGAVEKTQNPVSENAKLNPGTIYGLTKCMQTLMMSYYVRCYKLDIVMARPFNLSGDGVSKLLLLGNLQEQITAYITGKISRITLGDLSQRRDFLSIENACRDYIFIAKYGETGEIYNVGSGRSTLVEEQVKLELKKYGIPWDCIEIIGHHGINNVDEIYADISKLATLKKKVRKDEY